MAEKRLCPKCGAELSPDAAQGLCPKCLLDAGTRQPGSRYAGSARRAQFVPPDSGGGRDHSPVAPVPHSLSGNTRPAISPA